MEFLAKYKGAEKCSKCWDDNVAWMACGLWQRVGLSKEVLCIPCFIHLCEQIGISDKNSQWYLWCNSYQAPLFTDSLNDNVIDFMYDEFSEKEKMINRKEDCKNFLKYVLGKLI